MATSCIDILDQALLAQVVLTRKLSFPILLKRYVFILMSLESVRTFCVVVHILINILAMKRFADLTFLHVQS
jgi:hypothetical protein